MKLNEDWISRNWSFIQARMIYEVPANRFERIFKKSGIPTTGKFYGTEEFFNRNYQYGCYTHNGGKRLAMRPYITAPMAEQRVEAVFIDPKRYEFDTEGNIMGLATTYELPVVIFTR